MPTTTHLLLLTLLTDGPQHQRVYPREPSFHTRTTSIHIMLFVGIPRQTLIPSHTTTTLDHRTELDRANRKTYYNTNRD